MTDQCRPQGMDVIDSKIGRRGSKPATSSLGMCPSFVYHVTWNRPEGVLTLRCPEFSHVLETRTSKARESDRRGWRHISTRSDQNWSQPRPLAQDEIALLATSA